MVYFGDFEIFLSVDFASSIMKNSNSFGRLLHFNFCSTFTYIECFEITLIGFLVALFMEMISVP
ncbi:hypothetical protein ACTXT7_006666 [Hymenolepis weldensis]